MKYFLSFLLFICVSFSQEFTRNLPSENLQKILLPEKFPNMDAVIILKEQSYQLSKTKVYYEGATFMSPSTVYSKVLMVKLFNSNAIERYGNFEYEYFEKFGDEIKNVFDINARALKPNGDIVVLEDENIKRIVTRTTSKGDPLTRKVIFNFPDLNPGDILQLEYSFNNVYASSRSEIFYFNDRDYVMYSNLYITLPNKLYFKNISIPENKIGNPKVTQLSNEYGSGETYFWSLQNLYPIREEKYSLPFEDRAMLTAFIVQKEGVFEIGQWTGLGKQFYSNYLDKDNLNVRDLSEFNLQTPKKDETKAISFVDSLYYNLRKNFKLHSYNVYFPQSDDLGDIIEKKSGDASDLAYMMAKILDLYKIKYEFGLVRDSRKGIYEQSLPSLSWFDRLGLNVTIGGKQKFYDFDNSLPYCYENPWYLNNCNIAMVRENGIYHKKLHILTKNQIEENHVVKIDSTLDVLYNSSINMTGSFAAKIRAELGSKKTSEKNGLITDLFDENLNVKTDSITFNKLFENTTIELTSQSHKTEKAETFEKFLKINLENYSVNQLYKDLETQKRRTDISFDGPFNYNLSWNLQIPKGYKLKNDLQNKTINGFGKNIAEIKFQKTENKISVTGEFKIKNKIIRVKDYNKLINFIREFNEVLKQDIILEKS